MNIVIRIALVFVLIQFLVLLTAMTVALLLARPELPLLGRESNHEAMIRRFAAVVGLLPRGFRSAFRLMRVLRRKLVLPLHRA